MIEPALPEPCHLARPVDQRRERAELRAIVRLPPCVAVADQPGLPQHAEMLRYGRLRDAGPRRQGPARLLSSPAQPFEDGPPGRIGERSEEHIVSVRHLGSITRWLLILVTGANGQIISSMRRRV